MSDDNFGGAWLVTEYVYDPDGSFAGTVRQRRTVEGAAPGRLRVTQVCEPDSALAGHEMGAFAGEWVFELEVVGAHRRYLGPAVVGLGTEWQPGAMTGQGLWPGFGHEFRSYGVLVAPDRQLTGGFFSRAGRPVADIVGVAVPESLGVDPTLDLAAAAPVVGDGWQLSRSVGPMHISFARTTADERWCYAMTDSISDTAVAIETTTEFGPAIGSASTTTTFTIEPAQS